MEQDFSLYIDHQQIAQLVRELEQAVETCRSTQDAECTWIFIKMRTQR